MPRYDDGKVFTDSDQPSIILAGSAAEYGEISLDDLKLIIEEPLGSANQLLGVNAGATEQEYKTLSGTANQVTVTNGVGTIALSLPQSIATSSNVQFSKLNLGDGTFTGTIARIKTNISGLFTDSNTYGILMDGEIQSDATGFTRMYVSKPSASASVNSQLISHFRAEQGTFAGGSVVAAQYGFEASATMTGATINYGFYGNLTAGSGKFNLFMNGTAPNYINGNLQLGSTTSFVGSEKLQVTGATALIGALSVTGNTTLTGTATITSTLAVGSSMTIAGQTTLTKSAGGFAYRATTTDGAQAIYNSFANTGGNYFYGAASSTGGGLFGSNATAYALGLCAESARDFFIGTTNTIRLGIYSTGEVNIGSSTTRPSASALFSITSTTQGFLPPRMTTTQKNAISSPIAGLVVYDSTLGKLCVYTGAAWQTITSA